MTSPPLRDLRAPGEGEARERAWRLAEAAYEGRPRTTAPRAGGLVRRPAFAALLAAVVFVTAITPAGSAVADWVGDAVRFVVDEDSPPARASGAEELPGSGRLLVSVGPRDGGTAETWITGGGVRRRLLVGAGAVTWSPHARYVAAAGDEELYAVDLEGRRRWSVPATAPIHAVSWSPDGFRVAYITSDELRVVAGDGTGDRRVAPGGRAGRYVFGALAWRPGQAGHVLAFVKRHTVFLADLDQRRVLWRVTARDRPDLAFSPDGNRLLLAGRDGIRILDPRDGRVLHRTPDRASSRFENASWDRTGHRFAVVRRTLNRAELLLGRGDDGSVRLRRLFAAGGLDLVGFSPDNRWLLVDWTESGSWLFLPVAGGRPRQLTGVARRFDAEAVGPRGWCCPP